MCQGDARLHSEDRGSWKAPRKEKGNLQTALTPHTGGGGLSRNGARLALRANGMPGLAGAEMGSSWRPAMVLLLQASYYLKKKRLEWWGRTVSGSCVSPIFKLVSLPTYIFFTDITIMNWIFSGLSQEDRLWENYDSDQICLYLLLLLCYSYNHQIGN